MSRQEEACEQRIKAAELSPNDYSLAVAAATSLRLLDRKNEAEKWYRTVRTIFPYSISVHTNISSIFPLSTELRHERKEERKKKKLQNLCFNESHQFLLAGCSITTR